MSSPRASPQAARASSQCGGRLHRAEGPREEPASPAHPALQGRDLHKSTKARQPPGPGPARRLAAALAPPPGSSGHLPQHLWVLKGSDKSQARAGCPLLTILPWLPPHSFFFSTSLLVTPATFPWLRRPCLVSPCWCLISSVSLCLQPLHCSSNVPDPVPLQGICLDFPSPDPRMTPSLILQVFKLSPIPHCPSLPGFFSSPVSLLSDSTFP